MIEYEMTINIKVENKEVMENLLVTVESLNIEEQSLNSIELISISALRPSNAKHQSIATSFEHDSWLSPLNVNTA